MQVKYIILLDINKPKRKNSIKTFNIESHEIHSAKFTQKLDNWANGAIIERIN